MTSRLGDRARRIESAFRGVWREPQRRGLILGAAALALAATLNLVAGEDTYLVGLYALAPFVAAIAGGMGATVAVAILTLALGLAGELWSGAPSQDRLIAATAVILVAIVIATVAARARDDSRRRMDQLQILTDIATVAGSAPSLEETFRAVESAVVPGFADFCIIDRFHHERGAETRRYLISGATGSTVFRRRLIARSAPTSGRHLSDQEAVAGDGSWVRLVRDVDDATLRKFAFDEEDSEFLRSLGVSSLIRAELHAHGELLGYVTMVAAWSGRDYTADDARFASALSGRIALALDNSGLFRALMSAQTSQEVAMSVLDQAVVMHDRDGRLVFANQAAADLFGFDDPNDLVGLPATTFRRWCRIYDEGGARVSFDDLTQIFALVAERSEPPIARLVFLDDGRELWLRVRIQPVPSPNGETRQYVTAIEDLTAIKREEHAQSVLARTGELLSWGNDYEGILEGLAELAIPHLADCCSVDLLEPDGSLRRVAYAHRDPGNSDPELLRSGSTLKLDLAVGGRRRGQITLANEEERGPFDDEDRALAERVLERAGIALESAKLASERAEIARALQQGLVPAPLPEIPGWDIAAHYRSSGDEVEVGGDFYEAFRIRRGWMIVIGDVVGRGPTAASVTAQARYTLRTAGILSRDPRAALASLNRALVAREGSPLCSAAIVVLHEGSDRADVVVAGHPPPLRVEPTGEVFAVGTPGPVLGAFAEADWPVESFSIGRGRHLVLYTDGVTEAANGSERFGDDRLRDALLSASSPAGMLTRIEADLGEFCRDRLRDDVAVLTITPEIEMDPADDADTELVKSFYAAFDSRSIDRMRSMSDDRIEVDVPEVAISDRGRVYRGHAGLERCVEDLSRAWDDLIVTPRQFSKVGGRVVAKGRVYARGRSLGIRDVPMSWLWEIKDGRVVRCTSHPDLREALGLVGGSNG